ncbi:hypothetical protein K461DRAFT_312820 [Myriangium duriaei CBS 260.36]|uniref:Amidohydrolase 3 domain-containing protein n=1 Tax=Myriangium duriaei CBS 260.36 TaxID=1168546 RepID=A0A9P4J0X4_9PEZI|nr:hypothetical protein K461DRAFT_312820 [Myriangium duriaei CBS 260.36]
MCGGASLAIARALLGDPEEMKRGLQALQKDEPSDSQPSIVVGTEAVIYHGTILTMESGQFTPKKAMLVHGETIRATGTYDEIKAEAAKLKVSITERDLGSQCVMPGFVEPHLHLLSTALITGSDVTNMWYEKVKNKNQAIQAIKDAVAKVNHGDWIVAFGYDPSLTDDHVQLTLDITDAAAPNNPFLCGNPSGHLAYVNTAAFNKAGISVHAGTHGFPQDTYFMRCKSETGPGYESLNGIVLETAANTMANNLPKDYFDAERFLNNGRQLLRSWAEAGCTTVFDAGIGQLTGKSDDIDLTMPILQSPTPLPRYGGAIAIQALKDILKPKPGTLFPQPPPYVHGPLTLYSVKYWLDGSTQGFTAAVDKPYAESNNIFPFKKGFLDYRVNPNDPNSGPDDKSLLEKLKPIVTAGWQVLLHVNGTRAVEQALRVLPDALERTPYPHAPATMHRLEHYTADVTAKQISRTADLKLGVSHLIAHVGTWGDAFSNYVFKDHDRAARIDPVHDEMKAGLTVSLHSDSFTSPVQPLQYVDTAHKRYTRSGKQLGKDQCVTLEQAFAAVTYNPAKQIGQLEHVGSLEEGKKADFVVLSKDPRKVAGGHLHDQCKIEEVWIGGRQFPSRLRENGARRGSA